MALSICVHRYNYGNHFGIFAGVFYEHLLPNLFIHYTKVTVFSAGGLWADDWK